MAKKQMLTNGEIEKDIITALKNPPDIRETSYNKIQLPAIIAGIVLATISFIWPPIGLWVVLAAIVFLFAYALCIWIRRKIQIKRVEIRDYRISEETVHSIDEEHYYIKGSKRMPGKHVNNYVIRFENGKEWRIPKDNYLWSVERPMSDFAIYQSTHRGDTMIVATKIDTAKVVMAYHTEFFEYDS